MSTRHLVAASAVLFAAASCRSASSAETGTHDGEGAGGTVTVFAASSLTDAFTDLGEAFERQHPQAEVVFNFAGSQSLRTQIENGARGEVFASANPKHMAALVGAGLAEEPAVFAHNRMVIAVPAGNPAKIYSLADLANARRLVLAGGAVPAGAYAAKVLVKADAAFGGGFRERVLSRVVSREMHVRQTLHKVVLGEADAAMVYATDAAAAGDKVTAIAIDDEHNIVADYPIAVLGDAERPGLGQRFVAFVRSEAGRAILARHGFDPPADDARP